MIAALPGKLLAVVVPGPGSAAATVASLTAAEIPNLDVRTQVIEGSAALQDANRAARADVDYLAFVPAGTEWTVEHLLACITSLRNDLSIGMVGWSTTGAPAGSFELFVPLGGAVVRHSAFHAVEGFDPGFAALVDVDLGWRLWLCGYRVASLGAGGPGSAIADATEVPPLLASVLDDSSMVGDRWTGPEARAAQTAAAGRRIVIQRDRVRGDGELLPLVHASLRRWASTEPAVAGLVDELCAWAAPERSGPRRRIAVVTSDTLSARMAGPAIRALQIARRLAPDHDVVLASTERCDIAGEGFDARHVTERALRDLERWCDVLVFQGWVLAGRDFLVGSDKVLVADVYDPMHLEQLEQSHDAPGERGRFESVQGAVAVLNEQLERADFMLCASEKQRDLWLGQLAGLGRVNPIVYDGDESLRALLAVVPFGVGDVPPVQERHAIRGTVPGIGPDDKVILWGGGVYNWFDPLTLVRAVDALRHRLPTVRLLFLGMRHPNPGIPEMRMAVDTQRLAEELGLEGTHVFFNREWVDFEDRQNYLLDADIGVSTHLDHIETEFSFRTRILDYLWAGLPIVATAGDSFATVIEREGLGVVVPPADVTALELALERLLVDDALATECKRNIERVFPEMRWGPVLQPLADFCAEPHRAPDVACPDLRPPSEVPTLQRGWRRHLHIVVVYLRAGAGRLLVRRAVEKLRRGRG